MVEDATNTFGIRVHAVEVSKHYTPHMNQATTARCHISDHNINWDILVSYDWVVWNICQNSGSAFE
jgi:hypothetical protein